MTGGTERSLPRNLNVVLCPLYTLGTYKAAWESAQQSKGQNPTAKAWKRYCDDICEGAIWNLSLLNTEDVEGVWQRFATKWAIVFTKSSQ